MSAQAALDLLYMRRALSLAQAQLGRTAPNPAVGCVLVRDGEVVGEGATGDGGRPHAEEQALAQAGAQAAGACAYVTLEPCAVRSAGGRSCAELLTVAGVVRLVAAVGDPHPNAAGQGLARARAAGLEVLLGLEEARARALIAGFAHRVRTGLPLAEISSDPAGFDAALALAPDESLQAALERLGRAGANRVYAAPDSAAASALEGSSPLTAALTMRS
jgi:diaminohydroxyphosphoribosylaminopyrimidine deaminase/5-amino-6-(5-phosphoribosylamino)uracil reductase